MANDRKPAPPQDPQSLHKTFLLDHEELQVRLSGLRASHEASLGSMAAARNRAEDLLTRARQELEELKHARAATQAQLENSQAAQSEASQLAQSLRADLDLHRKSLRAHQVRCQEWEAKFKESERKRTASDSQLSPLRLEAESLTQSLQNSREENEALRAGLQESQSEAQRLNSLVKSLMSESRSLQADLFESRDGSEKLRKQLEVSCAAREKLERRTRILELIASKDSAVQAIEQERGRIPSNHPAHTEIGELLRIQAEQKRKLMELVESDSPLSTAEAPTITAPLHNQ